MTKAEQHRRAWEQRIRRQYGLTVEDVAWMWERQLGLCPICEKPLESKTWVIDHSHKTGKFRGLLCNWDNHRIVSFMERAGALRRRNVIQYLSQEGVSVSQPAELKSRSKAKARRAPRGDAPARGRRGDAPADSGADDVREDRAAFARDWL